MLLAAIFLGPLHGPFGPTYSKAQSYVPAAHLTSHAASVRFSLGTTPHPSTYRTGDRPRLPQHGWLVGENDPSIASHQSELSVACTESPH